MQSSQTVSSGSRLKAGAITGVIAGLIMAVVIVLVFTVVFGKNPLYPVQVIGSGAFGENALVGLNIGAVVAGLVIHIAISVVWGLIFGIIAGFVNVETPSKAFVYGVAIGVISMIDVYVLVPMYMNSMWGVDIWNREVPLIWDWAAHLIFGASFVFYPAVRRKF